MLNLKKILRKYIKWLEHIIEINKKSIKNELLFIYLFILFIYILCQCTSPSVLNKVLYVNYTLLYIMHLRLKCFKRIIYFFVYVSFAMKFQCTQRIPLVPSRFFTRKHHSMYKRTYIIIFGVCRLLQPYRLK